MMIEAQSQLSAVERHSLFEACEREAHRIGGDERTAEYFFKRAQSSRVWLSDQGSVTIADMDIADWCEAIAWSAPGITHGAAASQSQGYDRGKYGPRKAARSGAKFRRRAN